MIWKDQDGYGAGWVSEASAGPGPHGSSSPRGVTAVGPVWLCTVKPTAAVSPLRGPSREGSAVPQGQSLLSCRKRVLLGRPGRGTIILPSPGPLRIQGAASAQVSAGSHEPSQATPEGQNPPPRKQPHAPNPSCPVGCLAPPGALKKDIQVAVCPGLGFAEKAVGRGHPSARGAVCHPGDVLRAPGDSETTQGLCPLLL